MNKSNVTRYTKKMFYMYYITLPIIVRNILGINLNQSSMYGVKEKLIK